MSFMATIARPRAAVTSSRELERMILSVYGGGKTAAGVTVTPDSAMRIAAVHSCVKVLAQSVAQLPIHVYRKNGKKREVIDDHPLSELLHWQPNTWMTGFDMFQLIVAILCLRGNSLWLKGMVYGKESVSSLVPIHPDLIHSVEQDESYRTIYKIKRPKTGVIDEIPESKIIHFRGLSTNGFWGLSPIKECQESVGLAMATEQHGARLFSNGAQIGKVFKHPKRLSPQAHATLKESLNDGGEYAGVLNAHKTLILEEGMDVAKIGMTAEESQFLDTRKYQRSEIAGIFRVPPHMIGDLEKATFSNIEHQDLGFVKHTLTPWLVSIEQTLRKSLLSPADKKTHLIKFNVDGLLRGDIKSRNEAHEKAINGGWMSPNEVRALEDMSPYPGGDEYRKPLNMGAVGEKNDEPQDANKNQG